MRLGRIGVLMVIVALGTGGTACNPSIARRKGAVVSVELGPDNKICLADTVDAGSTYGNKSPRAQDCATGIIQGRPPEPGDCVILRMQGESPDLVVTPAEGC